MKVGPRTCPPLLPSYAQVIHPDPQLLHTLTHTDLELSNTSNRNLIKLRTLTSFSFISAQFKCQWSLGGFLYEHRRTPQPRK